MTRPNAYGPQTPGWDNVRARQGYYLDQPNLAEAHRAMRKQFPDDSHFDGALWKENVSKFAPATRTINVNEFDLCASAQGAEGGGPPDTFEALVLSNNSSHYILATRAAFNATATVVDSFSYVVPDAEKPQKILSRSPSDALADWEDAEDTFTMYIHRAYTKALDAMVAWAKSH